MCKTLIFFLFLLFITKLGMQKQKVMKFKTLFISILVIFLFPYLMKAQCDGGESVFILNIVPDGFPQEITWSLTDSSGYVIYESIAPGEDLTYIGCIPDNICYTFTIYDSFGDGFLGNDAYYQVYIDAEEWINSGGGFGSEESTTTCEIDSGGGTSLVCEDPLISFEVSITPDIYPQEITWDLKGADGNTIFASSSPGSDFEFSGCIEDGECMTFTIYDSYGDGLSLGGGYQVYIDGVLMIEGEGDFSYSESTSFNCLPGSDCGSPFMADGGVITLPAGNSWWLFIPDSTGMYEFNACSDNSCGGSTIWIYDYCAGLEWNETNEGTIFYSNDGCGIGSEYSFLNIPLEEGATYYIRIRYDDTGCTDTSMEGTISFSGPVIGCTDPTACNFSPLATANDGSCIYPGDPECPDGPDLTIEQGVLVSSMYVASLDNSDACLIQEGCVSGYGQREVIRFTTHIKNIGNADYYIGEPQENNQWEWDPCHNHWHYEGYAEYVLFDMDDGTELPIGFKNGFCVMDLECDDGGTYQYGCDNQGISKQCGDIYSSGLECQWIDITDVEEGDYMLVVKVNWDQTPDVLGRVETDFENNWAQVCINIARDPVSGEASFTVLEKCAPYEDCLGQIFGNAQPDCNGECAGVSMMGDINIDTSRTLTDMTIYMLESLLDTITPTTCLDLNNDGEITVTDATLLFDCVLHGSGSIPADHQHTPCEFPYGVLNPNDKATLQLADLNEEEQYVDVHLKNPNGRILSFEFDMEGIVIDYVVQFIPDYYPNILFDENEIIAVTYDESSIGKNADFVPFLRIYYTDIDEEGVCLGHITDFVNDDHEEILHAITGDCLVPMIIDVNDLKDNPFAASVVPNPVKNRAVLTFQNENNALFRLEVLDVLGKKIFQDEIKEENTYELPVAELGSGIYFFVLKNNGKISAGKFIVE